MYPGCMHSVSNLMGQMNNALWLVRYGNCLSPSPSVFYIHYVLLFPMKLVAYSSAVWQIRCAVKWSMTESSGRLDPLQSYPAITIPSFLWGNTQGRERKLDQILVKKAPEWQGKEMKQSIFHLCQSISRFVSESNVMQIFQHMLRVRSGCTAGCRSQVDWSIVINGFTAFCHHFQFALCNLWI